MQKRIKSLLKDNILAIAISITITIAYLSLINLSQTNITFKSSDKLHHLLAYFFLSVSWLASFYKKPILKYRIVLACIIYGIIIEVLQETLTMYRTADYKDVLANTIGILLGLIVFNQILKKIKLN